MLATDARSQLKPVVASEKHTALQPVRGMSGAHATKCCSHHHCIQGSYLTEGWWIALLHMLTGVCHKLWQWDMQVAGVINTALARIRSAGATLVPFDSTAFDELAISAWPGATADTIPGLDAASNYESIEVLGR